MSQVRARRRKATWSLWTERRMPSEYEAVTYKYHYHFRRDPVPFELSPDWSINQWYLKYREGSPFNVDDWEGVRDPYRYTYRAYVAARHEREVYVDNLLDEFERHDHYRSLDGAWLDFLGRVVLPARFPLHALQMTSAYIAKMAPTSFVTNMFHFQAGDEMRRIQRIAYLAKALALDNDRPDLADSAKARTTWEEDADWQPVRELVEKHLVAYDWGEAFAARNLVVKPILDEFVNVEGARIARANGDELLALMLDDFQDYDTRYSRDTTKAVVDYALGKNPELKGVLQGWVDKWAPLGHAAAEGLARLFASAPKADSAETILGRVGERYAGWLNGLGLELRR